MVLTKDQLFCQQYNLPDNEVVIYESAAEINIVSAYSHDSYKTTMIHFHRKTIFDTTFLIFRDAYDRKSCSFTIHLSTIKKSKDWYPLIMGLH